MGWVAAIAFGLVVLPVYSVDIALDCGIREFAYNYSKSRGTGHGWQSIFDALELGSKCNLTCETHEVGHTHSLPSSNCVYFISDQHGSDANPGTLSEPFKTITRGLKATRKRTNTGTACTLALRGGTYFTDTISLGPQDSHLTLTSFPPEKVIISGGQSFTPSWKPVTLPWNGKAAHTTQVPANISPFTQVFINGRRAIRARHPNGNPETSGLWTHPTGYIKQAKSWVHPPRPGPPSQTVLVQNVRNTTKYENFETGIGGAASVFQPPISYWAPVHPQGGCQYEVPIGLQFEKGDFPTTTFTHLDEGVVHAFHVDHWGNWMWQLHDFHSANNTFLFGKGGFQEARGSCGSGGHEYYVSNIPQLLDSENEFYYFSENRTLYYIPNGTLPTELIVSQRQVLLDVRNTTHITVAGIQFSHSEITFLSSYEVPSGGDWSIHRGAALQVSHSDNILIQNNLLSNLGGNGVLVNSTCRYVTVDHNEFVWLGDSGILIVGNTKFQDGTDNTVPINTTVANNLLHEVGIWGKQTGGIFQAKSYLTVMRDNIIFNGPRSGINMNDGFGGGNLITGNVLFNLVRETVDHGPFNSWDRMPFVTTATNPKGSSTPEWSHVNHNFLICNYNGIESIDHDDGSSYYHDHNNFIAYGMCKIKGEFIRNSKNVYVQPTPRHCVGWQIPINKAPAFAFTDSYCIQDSGIIYNFIDTPCTRAYVAASNNNVFVSKDAASAQIRGCQKMPLTWQNWTSMGFDVNSQLTSKMPTVQEIITIGQNALNANL